MTLFLTKQKTPLIKCNKDNYFCQMGHLSVVIPPDIVDSVTEGSSAQEGGSIRLTCTATGVPPPTVLWRREHNRPIVFRHDGGRERKGELMSCFSFYFLLSSFIFFKGFFWVYFFFVIVLLCLIFFVKVIECFALITDELGCS